MKKSPTAVTLKQIGIFFQISVTFPEHLNFMKIEKVFPEKLNARKNYCDSSESFSSNCVLLRQLTLAAAHVYMCTAKMSNLLMQY